MAKISWKPGTLLAPLPPALVSCGSMEKPNVLTIAWTGIIASDPVTTYISVRPERYSYNIIKKTREFVINLPNLQMVTAVDFCGVKSGKNIDKFKEMNLTAYPSNEISAPQIEEAPVSLECKVTKITKHGSHDMFVAEVVAVSIDDKYLNEEGRLCLEKAGLIAFCHGQYFTFGRVLGNMGFSVNKKRLAQMEKMKNVKVEVKQPKIIKEKEEEEVKPRKSKKFAKPRLQDRSDKPRGDKKPFDRKPEGKPFDKNPSSKPFDKKPTGKSFGSRSDGKSFDRKPAGKPFGSKPGGNRSFGSKPSGNKSFGPQNNARRTTQRQTVNRGK